MASRNTDSSSSGSLEPSWTSVTSAWTVDNDLITPTFKVKRNRIEDVYARHYETWVASGRKVIWLVG